MGEQQPKVIVDYPFGCGHKLRFPYHRQALVVICPICRRSFIWTPADIALRANFLKRLKRILLPKFWMWVGIVAVPTFLLLVIFTRDGRKSQEIEKPVPIIAEANSVQSLPSIQTFSTGKETLQPSPSNPKPLGKPTKRHTPVPLPNATNLAPPNGPKGLSVLVIDNITDWDAAVKLIRVSANSRSVCRYVYVQQHHQVTLTDIAPGIYELMWLVGQDWNKQLGRFQEIIGAFKAGRQLKFTERKTAQRGILATEIHVTLHEVPLGNVRKVPISEDEFFAEK